MNATSPLLPHRETNSDKAVEALKMTSSRNVWDIEAFGNHVPLLQGSSLLCVGKVIL
jgi:hypothetical protein